MLDNLSSRMSIFHPIDSFNAGVAYTGIASKMAFENVFGQ